MIGLTASVTFMILYQFAPNVPKGARLGAGFGIGSNMTGGMRKKTKNEKIKICKQWEGCNDPLNDKFTRDTCISTCNKEYRFYPKRNV